MPTYAPDEILDKVQDEITDFRREVDRIDTDDETPDSIMYYFNAEIDGLEYRISKMEVEDCEPEERDPEDAINDLVALGYTVIQTDNLADAQKLEDFLRNELFPLSSDFTSKVSLP